MRSGCLLVCVLFFSLLIAGVLAEQCPNFQYVAGASTEVTGLTKFECDLKVPSAPRDIGAGNIIPPWGIFPFVEPVIDQNNPRYGILQPVLEWNYLGQTNQWTVTSWYVDDSNTISCSTDLCRCTADQKALSGGFASTKNYRQTVPDCHNRCEPKHGQRITAQPGDTLHFVLEKSGESQWTTTATNTRTQMKTTFGTTCIKSNDAIRVGVALENSHYGRTPVTIDKNRPDRALVLPGDIKFTNLEFTGQNRIQLTKFVDANAKSCFPGLDVRVDTGFLDFLGFGSTNSVTIVTEQTAKHDEL